VDLPHTDYNPDGFNSSIIRYLHPQRCTWQLVRLIFYYCKSLGSKILFTFTSFCAWQFRYLYFQGSLHRLKVYRLGCTELTLLFPPSASDYSVDRLFQPITTYQTQWQTDSTTFRTVFVVLLMLF